MMKGSLLKFLNSSKRPRDSRYMDTGKVSYKVQGRGCSESRSDLVLLIYEYLPRYPITLRLYEPEEVLVN